MKTIITILLALFLVNCGLPKGDRGETGADGRPGLDGRDAIVEIIDPCGPSLGYDEIILRLGNGSLVAYFQNGVNEFLIDLHPGEYVTTDGQACHFTVDYDLNVLW